jgi:hypothetical protein
MKETINDLIGCGEERSFAIAFVAKDAASPPNAERP